MKGIVWGYTWERGIEQLDRIEQNYQRMGYEIIKKTKGMTTYEFVASNGDFWRVAQYSESSRGHKANIAYIDHDIELDFIDRVIKPTLISLPFQGIKYF